MSLNLDKSSWKRVRLGEVIRRSRKQCDPLKDGVERYVAGGHVESHAMTIERWGDANDGQMGSTFRYLFEPGQILFVSARPYLRKTGVVHFSGVVADKTYVLDAVLENGLLQDFLPFLVSSETFVNFATAQATGSMNPRLLWRPFQRFEFDLPPLDEQRRLADLLWAVERDAQARSAIIDSAERVIDRWMLQVTNDAGVRRVPLSDLIEYTMGGVWGTDKGESEIDVRVIRGTDITVGGEIKWPQTPARSVKESEFRSRQLCEGDVLIEKSGGSPEQPVGKVGLVGHVESPAVPSNFVLLVRADRHVCEPEFLFSLIRGMWRHGGFARFTGKTTNISNLRTKELLATEVGVPSLENQRHLVLELKKLTQLREDALSALVASRGAKSALLADVFGGG